MIEEYLLEVLVLIIGIVLTGNVGLLKFIYDRTRQNEDDINKLRKDVMTLYRTIFGHEDDKTNDGHLVHTENQLEDLHDRLEEISDVRKEEYKELRSMLCDITEVLAEEESVDIKREDFGFSD